MQLLPVVADISSSACACKLLKIFKEHLSGLAYSLLSFSQKIYVAKLPSIEHTLQNIGWISACWLQFHNPVALFALVVSLLLCEGGKSQVPSVQLRHNTVFSCKVVQSYSQKITRAKNDFISLEEIVSSKIQWRGLWKAQNTIYTLRPRLSVAISDCWHQLTLADFLF